MINVSRQLYRPAMIGFALIQLASLSACTNMQLIRVQETVPQDIAATSQVLKVNNRHKINNLFSDGYFEIGDYRVTRVKKDSTSQSSSQMGFYSQSSTKTGFQFTIADAQNNWDVRCNVRYDGNVLKIFGVDGVSQKSQVHCTLKSVEGNATVELTSQMDSPTGVVIINQSRYDVRAYTYENSHPDRMRIPRIYGFRIDADGRNLGAIELSSTPGRAWLNPVLPQQNKTAMVGALAALFILHAP